MSPRLTLPVSRQVLAPDTLLALCQLACWLLREPVMPADLLRWALDGCLPYLLLGDACTNILAAALLNRPPIDALLPPGLLPYHAAMKLDCLCGAAATARLHPVIRPRVRG